MLEKADICPWQGNEFRDGRRHRRLVLNTGKPTTFRRLGGALEAKSEEADV
ncbi:hypothetical protein LJR030_001737 [Rhizobium sp. LjRoot30]|uniref:hypothetical protein n=1 Tax=Rhizobium sp. LjRoot30 TaxID=3342320 RepID=UPI003ED0E07E